MKLALLSDLHANAQALDACLAHAREIVHADRFAFLGDLVGYGASPGTVVDTVMALAARGAIVLKGNHDAMAVRPPTQVEQAGDEGAAWTHSQLSDTQRSYLDQLPLTWQEDSMLLVHASADAPESWRYADNKNVAADSLDAACGIAGVRHVFGGHVHHQTLYYRGAAGKLMEFHPSPGVAVPVPGHRQWLATVGSVGQPRDRDPRAMYAVFDSVQQQLVFYRVAYDHLGAADAIRRAWLPASFANRLEQGQ
jgi:diadenosine tetraphosphatase ApaH/serine/threonine PP2A family protein phosphatase